jgi:hypothetical protein
MSATKIGNRRVPLPRISRIRAFPDFRISVLWAEGPRAGAADTVDLVPVINTYKIYGPLRKNRKLFQTAHLVDGGSAIAWGDGSIGISARLIEDIADQGLTPKDFAAPEPIPRVIALARYRQEPRQKASDPVSRQKASDPVSRQKASDPVSRQKASDPASRQKASDPASSPSAQGGGGRAGWLSGLLSRAPQDEPAPRGGRSTGWLSGLLSRASQDEPAPRGGHSTAWLSEILTRASQAEPAPRGARAGGISEIHARASQAEPARGDGRDGWHSEPLARAPQDEPAPRGGRAGWHSEPLSRPPQDEPARGGGAPAYDPDAGAPHTVESLDALAVDIARMVDHDAVADLWDSYKRGEGNVFARMLYTMQGEEAFDEVRRMYRGDRDFMRTVDRYIGEFERLLADVSRDDHGHVLARNYLTSETGEVYTMLAQAAGRFDRNRQRGDEHAVRSRRATSR